MIIFTRSFSVTLLINSEKERREKIDHYQKIKSESAKDLEMQKYFCHPYCNWGS